MSDAVAIQIEKALRAASNPEKAAFFPRFFRAYPGGYGEGDRFLGVVVPQQRRIAKQFRDLPQKEVVKLLDSPFHECRCTAVFIMILQFERGDEKERARVYKLCLRKMGRINNWDLIDAAAPRIGGPYLLEHRDKRKEVEAYLTHRSVWKRRWAVMCTFAFIRQGEFEPTLRFAKRLLEDEHDLIHKAVGWMLREIGKKDLSVERAFLDRYASRMPRTMLRYAIEKFPPVLRKPYLSSRLASASVKSKCE